MTNDQVITELAKILAELIKRRGEIDSLLDDPNVPLHELADREMLVTARLSSLDIRIMHLRARLNKRRLAKSLGKSVPPLSPARANAMKAVLTKVSKSIAAVNTFKAAIKLATEISDAATKAFSATG